ncbi:MAG: hypothetical protein R3C28_21765 [Pirellulaceae bacterium]
MIRRLRWMLVGLLSVVCVVSAMAQETTAPKRFRRVFVPDERLPTVIQRQYLPFPQERFDRIVQLAENQMPGSALRTTRITDARFTGSVSNNALVGSAVFEIHHNNMMAREISLFADNVRFHELRWSDGRPAQWGTDSRGRPVLVVEQSGTVECMWQTPLSENANMMFVDFTFPASKRAELTIDDSQDLASNVAMVDGVVIKAPESASTGTTVFRPNGQGRLRFRFWANDQPLQTNDIFLTQSNQYRVAETGIESTSVMRLDGRTSRLEQLHIQLPPGMRAQAFRVGGAEVQWRVAALEDGASIVTVDLEPFAADDNESIIIRCNAYAELSFDVPQMLPRLRPHDVFWLQEKTTLNFASECEVTQLELEDARFSNAADSSASETAPGSVSILLEEPQAKVLFQVRKQQPSASLDSTTVVRLSDGRVDAVVAASVTGQKENVFQLHAHVADGWSIESVSSVPDTRLRSWTLNQVGNQRMLELVLQRPIMANETTVFRIALAQRLDTSGQPLSLTALHPIVFAKLPSTAERVLLQATESYQLQWQDFLQSVWSNATTIPETVRGLLDLDANQPCLDLLSQDQIPSVRLVPQTVSLAGDVRVECQVGKTNVNEQFTFDVRPLSSSVSEITIHFLDEQQVPFAWDFAGNQDVAIDAQSVLDRPLQTVRLLFSEPLDEPFTVTANRTVGRLSQQQVTLARILNASEQSGQIDVVAASTDLVRTVANSRLERVNVDKPPENFRFFERYLYSPNSDTIPGQTPLLLESANQRNGHFVIQKLQMESFVTDSLEVRHFVSILASNYGVTEFRFQCPLVLPEQLSVNGRRVTVQAHDGHVTIPLDPTMSAVSIHFPLQESKLSHVSSPLTAPRLDFDQTILASAWKVWTPPRFGLSSSRPGTAESSGVWLERWFGPAVRNPESRPLDFFSEESWLGLFARLRRITDAREITAAAEFVETLQRHNPESASSTETSAWFSLLQDCQTNMVRFDSTRPLLVDALRLREAGVVASATVDRTSPGSTVMDQHDLVLAILDSAMVLTTSEGVASFQGQLDWLRPDRLVRIRQRMTPVNAVPDVSLDGFPLLVGLDEWNDRPAATTQTGWASNRYPYLVAGWSLHTLPVENGSIQIQLRDQWRVAVWKVILFLTATAVSWWAARRSMRFSLAVCVAATLTTLFAPLSWSAWGTISLWGCAAGILIRWSRTQGQRATSVMKAVRRSALGSTNASWISIVLMVTCIAVDGSWGQTTGSGPGSDRAIEANERQPPVDVFIPWNGTSGRASEFVYVPLELLESLVQFEAEAGEAASAYLLQSARYQVSLPTAGQGSSATITTAYSVHVQIQDSQLSMLFPQSTIAMLQREATINGQPTKLQLILDEGKCIVPIDGPGAYEMEFKLTVPLAAGRMRWQVPRIPQAVLSVAGVTEKLDVTVWGDGTKLAKQNSTTSTALAAGQFTADVSMVADVSMEISSVRNSMEMDRSADLISRLELDVQPHDVTVHFHCEADSADVDVPEIVLLVDDRLKIDVTNSDQPNTLEDVAGPMQRLRFYPQLSDDGMSQVDTTFTLLGVSGLGYVRVPKIEIENAVEAERWLGIRMSDEIAGRLELAPANKISPQQFAEVWNENGAALDFAYRNVNPDGTFVLKTRLIDTPPDAESVNLFLIEPQQTRHWLLTNIQTYSNGLAQLHVQIPASAKVQRVFLVQDRSHIPLQWSLGDEHTARIVLPRAITSSLFVVVEATSPAEVRELQPMTLPLIGGPRQMVVYRQSNLTVDVVPNTDLQSASNTSSQAISSFIRTLVQNVGGKRIGTWRESTGHGSLEKAIVDRQPAFHASLVHLLENRANSWFYEVFVQVEATQGTVDRIRFTGPEVWRNAVIDGAVQWSWLPSPVPGEWMYQADFNSPLQKRTTFRLVTEMNPALQEFNAPILRIADTEAESNFFVLPVQKGSLPFTWDLTNLESRALPADQSSLAKRSSGFETFGTTDGAFQVRLVRGEIADADPIVVSQDRDIRMDQQTVQVTERIRLQGNQARQAQWQLPNSAEVTLALVDDISVDFAPIAADRILHLPLAVDAEFQDVMLIYQYPLHVSENGSIVLETAKPVVHDQNRIGDISTASGLPCQWTIHTWQPRQILSSIEVSNLRRFTTDLGEQIEFQTSNKRLRIELVDVPAEPSDWLARLIAAVSVVCVTLVLWSRGVSNRHVLVARWAHAFGVLLGVVWWLWLAPSSFGWALILLSLGLAYFSRWSLIRWESPAPQTR